MRTVILSIFVFQMIFGGILLSDDNYVTVYNEDLALVKQVRSLTIKQGDLPLKFTDVAAKLIPTSVHLRSLSGNKNFRILEQNFEYDLVSASKILEKYIDHPIEIIRENGELVSGTLLSKSSSSLVLKTDNGIRIHPWNDKMTVSVKELPEGLITKPTLIWELSGIKDGTEKLELSYLTNGMSWESEYVGVLNENSTEIQLDAWVNITNHSGATFKDAHLKLVAGDVHRAPAPQRYRAGREEVLMMSAAVDKGFEERAFFDYHIYDLDRPTTIKDMQMKQIALFPPATVSSEKKYYYNANMDATKIAVKVLFKNDEKAGLGKPLPAGIFRVYQKDQESLEFVGEDRIDHTPRNEEVKITVGKAFDLVGEKTVVEREKVSQRSERQKIEIELRNNKEKEDVTIIIEEFFYRPNWKIEESNFTYQKKSAQQVEFSIPVKANGKAVLSYTVLYTW